MKERESGIMIHKRDKCNVPIRHVSDRLQDTASNMIANIFHGRIWMQIAQVHCAIAELVHLWLDLSEHLSLETGACLWIRRCRGFGVHVER